MSPGLYSDLELGPYLELVFILDPDCVVLESTWMLIVEFSITSNICIDGFPTGSSGAPSAGVCVSFTGANEASGAAG